jgi:hypothetical protein
MLGMLTLYARELGPFGESCMPAVNTMASTADEHCLETISTRLGCSAPAISVLWESAKQFTHTGSVNIPNVLCLGVEFLVHFIVTSKRYWRLPKNDLVKTVGHVLQHESERLCPIRPHTDPDLSQPDFFPCG